MMANETPEQVRALPNYINNRVHSVVIIGWGGPFTLRLRPDGARSIVLQRSACNFSANPFGGAEFAATGIFANQQAAEAAAAQVAQLGSVAANQAYAHYVGPENLVLPTIINEVTAPELTRALRASVEQEGRDANAASNLLVEVFLLAVGLRGAGAASGLAPGAGRVPGPPAPQQISAVRAFTSALAGPWRSLNTQEMLQLVRLIWREYPLVQRVYAARNLAGARQITELESILAEFSRTTGVVVRRVPTGTVQAARGTGNFASLRVQEGVLMIEEQVFSNAPQLLSEVRHELAFFYSTVGGRARIGETGFQAMMYVEMAMEAGIDAIASLLRP